ncbi:hypothetical protein chiPu_0023482 [Chiloscyllium punctatum]|uniref:Uncharacterized protein n=1 Tax=Chiloscyllium punctatum TaxID=137246 RepID=A0A401TAV5_CHIPU|nr:hypothetical protein [Chiloscyllium punctatum]
MEMTSCQADGAGDGDGGGAERERSEGRGERPGPRPRLRPGPGEEPEEDYLQLGDLPPAMIRPETLPTHPHPHSRFPTVNR